MKTLKDFIPEYAHLEFKELINKKGHLKILLELDGTEYPFPYLNNNYKNIFSFALLENGSVIGFNESPRNGFSFPVIGKKSVDKFYEAFPDLKPKSML